MSITYAGVTLGILTERYRSFLEHWHSLTDFTESQLWGYDGYGISHLPLPPKPMAEESEVGHLVWPTEMSRCAYAHYIVPSAKLDDIRTALGSTGGPATLEVSDGNGGSVSTSMYFIAARPLSQITNQPQAYLLTLVDKRWYKRTLTGSITSTPASWSDLFTSLATALGITLTVDTISSNYSAPTDRWVVYEKPLSVLLDAACNAIGHRLVANLDGTYKTVIATTANSNAASQIASLTKTAGGTLVPSDIPRQVPSTIKTIFKATADNTNPHTETVTLASLSLAGYGSATGVTGQTASFNGELVYTGSNGAACVSYATQVATDYYNWQLANLDVTYPGIVSWTPTGSEDRVIWKYENDKILTRLLRGPFQNTPKGGYELSSDLTTTDVETIVQNVIAGGCNWFAAMGTSHCLLVSVNGVATSMYLNSTDGDTWTSPDLLTICGTDYTVSVDRNCGGVPTLSLTGTTSGATAICGQWQVCGCAYSIWGFNLQTLCPSQPYTGNLCTNLVQIRVDGGNCLGGISCDDTAAVITHDVIYPTSSTWPSSTFFHITPVTAGQTYYLKWTNGPSVGAEFSTWAAGDCSGISPIRHINGLAQNASITIASGEACLCVIFNAFSGTVNFDFQVCLGSPCTLP